MTPLEISVTIDAQTITAFGVMVVAVFGAYGTVQQRQVAKRVEEVADLAKDDHTLAAETKAVIDETHKLTNSGLTDIKAQLVTALADRDQLQIALATANERLTQQPGGETLS